MSVLAPAPPSTSPPDPPPGFDGGLDVVPAPERRHRRPPRRLRTVSAPRRHRSPTVPVLVGTGIVLVALFALAAMHALLISGQVHLDAMRRDVASEHEQIRRLELREAELESPGRVLDAARQRLGMVEPGEVGYLLPGSVTADEAPIRVDAAEPAPEPVTDGTTAGDTAEGDRADDAGADGRADPVVRPENSDEPATTHAVDRPSEGGRDE